MSTSIQHQSLEGNAEFSRIADPEHADADNNLVTQAAFENNISRPLTLEVGGRSELASRGFSPASVDQHGDLWFSHVDARLSYPLPSVELATNHRKSNNTLSFAVADSQVQADPAPAPGTTPRRGARQEVITPQRVGEVSVPEWQKAEANKRAISTIEDPKATFQQKSAAFSQLFESGDKGPNGRVKVVLMDGGNARTFEIERLDVGKGAKLMHVFSPDANGHPHPVLRWVERNGTIEQQKQGSTKVDFHGSWWNANVPQSTVSQYAERGASPARPPQPNPEVVLPPPERPPAPAWQQQSNERYKPGSINRSQFDRELNDPRVMAAFAGRMRTEVGSQGRAAQIAWAETVMNRAVSRNQTLMQALTGRYYPTHSPGSSNRPDLIAAVRMAWLEGTDTTSGSTGNASGSVGFGRTGREVIRIGGEKFGYEEVDLGKGWLKKYRQLKVPAR